MSINLNNTTPAAATGGTNVTFQRDVSGNVSAYISAAQAIAAASVNLTAQAANIGATALIAVPVDSTMYRVTVYIVQSQVATTSGTLPSVVLSYKDKNSGAAVSQTVTATNSANVLGTLATAEAVAYVDTAVALSYATTGYASVGGTPLQYALHIRVESM